MRSKEVEWSINGFGILHYPPLCKYPNESLVRKGGLGCAIGWAQP